MDSQFYLGLKDNEIRKTKGCTGTLSPSLLVASYLELKKIMDIYLRKGVAEVQIDNEIAYGTHPIT